MIFLRQFTWYFRFSIWRSDRWPQRVPGFGQPFSQFVVIFCYLLLPGAFDWTLLTLLYGTGLSQLIGADYLPSFLSTKGFNICEHGALT